MREVVLRYARRADGGRVAYEVHGDSAGGSAVVLLHPIGLDRTIWQGWIGPLVDAGHLVLVIDLPGHGDSDPEPDGPSFPRMAAAVATVLEAEQCGPASIVGTSMGGMVAQALAIEAPALVRSLVLCCTMASVPDAVRPAIRQRGADARTQGMDAVIDSTIERWLSPTGRESEVAEQIRRRLHADDPDTFAACWEMIAGLDMLSGLAGVAAPALILAGGSDISLPPDSDSRLAAAIPDARLVVVPGAWHLGPYEDPAPFLSRTLDFLVRYSGLSVI